MKKLPKTIVTKGLLGLFIAVFLFQLSKPLVGRQANVTLDGLRHEEKVAIQAASAPVDQPRAAKTSAQLSGSLGAPIPPEKSAAGTDSSIPDSFHKIIRSAQLTAEVKNVDEAYGQILTLLNSVSGYVLNSTFTESGTKRGTLVMEVPSDRFHETLVQLDKIGKIISKSVNGQDVTSEYIDLQSRLRHLIRVEAQFTQLLTQARNIAEILTVQRELDRVQTEIEQAKGRLQYLSQKSAMAQISIDLNPTPISIPPQNFMTTLLTGLRIQVQSALKEVALALVQTVSTLAILGIWAVAYLAPLAFAIFYAAKCVAKFRSQPTA